VKNLIFSLWLGVLVDFRFAIFLIDIFNHEFLNFSNFAVLEIFEFFKRLFENCFLEQLGYCEL